jgi:hypothetical protein
MTGEASTETRYRAFITHVSLDQALLRVARSIGVEVIEVDP